MGFAAAVIWASALSMSYAPVAHADQAEQSPVEMLQDGLDALVERQTDLATQLFEQLILAFPGTDQAIRAERELGALSASGDAKSAGDARGSEARGPDTRAALDRRMPVSLEALRMKFAMDAGDRVFFAENSAVIGGRARALIDHQARWLAARPELKITVIGRADDGASIDESRDLSAKRAEAVREKLVGSGIEASRITIDARGTR
ncbi:MAG: OmpA family protein, partial [Hyphomicrobium sp.]